MTVPHLPTPLLRSRREWLADALPWLGAGMAVGGWLSETRGPKAPFVAGAVTVAAMALLARQLPVRRVPHGAAAPH